MHNHLSNKKKSEVISGKIRPLILAFILLIAGLLLDKWWWQIGAFAIVAIFISAYYQYKA